MGLTVAVAILAGVVVAVFQSEFQAGLPWIAERLRRLALKSVKGALRERLDEEWSAFLADMPTPLSKLGAAIGFFIAANRLKCHNDYIVGKALVQLLIAVGVTTVARALARPIIGKGNHFSRVTKADVVMARMGQHLMVKAFDLAGSAIDEILPTQLDFTPEVYEKAARLPEMRNLAVDTVRLLRVLEGRVARRARAKR